MLSLLFLKKSSKVYWVYHEMGYKKKVQQLQSYWIKLPAFLYTPKKSFSVPLFYLCLLFFVLCNVLVLNSYRLFGSYCYFRRTRFYRGENSIFLCLVCYLRNDFILHRDFLATNCPTKMVLYTFQKALPYNH